MDIIRGKIKTAQKIVLYGPEGIGKTTFASQFPSPVFLDTEGSTKHIDVARFPRPLSWGEFGNDIKELKNNPEDFKTLVIDTCDWAEILCTKFICAKEGKNSIEDFGYGKGYTYVQEEFGKLLNFLSEFIDMGINVVITAHAKMRKFEQPDESGAYDRWELKLSKGVAPLVKEWADMLLFANYKTFVVKDDNNHVKAKGGQRVMYTTHMPCWDAKNRHELPDEVPFSFESIKHCIPDIDIHTNEKENESMSKINAILDEEPLPPSTPTPQNPTNSDIIPPELKRLMEKYDVSEKDIQIAVANNNYYPADTPIANYDPSFIQGKIIAGWDQFYKAVQYYKTLPFTK